MLGIQLPSDWNVESDVDHEEAIAAHHGELVARQMAKVIPDALPWDESTDESTLRENLLKDLEMDCG